MTREEKQKAIYALKKSAPIMPLTQEEFSGQIQAINQVIDWLEQEPCDDCIRRDSAIKALDYDIKCFEFKSGVSKHMDDIAKLLNTIYETQVNNIKTLPSVPQEPILEKINKMKSEIADSLEFWDYSPNNNPLARDMLETITNFWGDVREAESGDEE